MMIKDMVGYKNEYFEVIECAVMRRQNRVSWFCRCRCGNLFIATGKDLRTGKVRSCGCLKRRRQAGLALTGQMFGFLQAIERTEKRDKKGSVIWKCVCLKCGAQNVERSADALVHGRNVSCGCVKREHAKNINLQLHRVDGTCLEAFRRKPRSDSKTGVKGVQARKSGRFRAHIGLKGQWYDLGTYDTLDRAMYARILAENFIHKAFAAQYNARYDKDGKTKDAAGTPEFVERKLARTGSDDGGYITDEYVAMVVENIRSLMTVNELPEDWILGVSHDAAGLLATKEK